MTFQCKKGYFWSSYCSGPHRVIPVELIRSNRDTVRKGQEAHLIHNRGTQREYSSKPLKHSIVKRVLVFKRWI